MDVNIIRCRFIQENLRRALQERDRERAIRALNAFRLYFHWFEHQLPTLERVAILGQLASLEKCYCSGPGQGQGSVSGR